jgi:threonine dehydratase
VADVLEYVQYEPKKLVRGLEIWVSKAVKDGKIECLDHVSTIADGIAVKEPGSNTFELCRKYVDDIVTVTDDEISTAILTLIEKHKLIAEGAGAVPVAAVMFNKVPVKGKKVVCLVSGGNIDVTILSRVILV